MRLVGGTGSSKEPRLPPGYVLDHSDPDVLVLLCPQGTAVARRFSTRGAAAEAIEREARVPHRERNRSARRKRVTKALVRPVWALLSSSECSLPPRGLIGKKQPSGSAPRVWD